MDETELLRLARSLDEARRTATPIEPLTRAHPALGVADAYAVQAAGVRLRLERGERQVGYKMGLTSEAKRQQMGLHAPVYGVLTDAMRVQDGATFRLAGRIHPKIEPELAFVTGRELRGRVSLDEARAACEGVAPAMEILDSRYRHFKYFSLPDVIADNSSSSFFVVAARFQPLGTLALDDLPMAMSVNGSPRQAARSSAISGHPLVSVVQLCELLHERGLALPAGSIVLAGAATVAEVLTAGDEVRLEVPGLGDVRVRTAA